jgi:hypothetical protein
MLERGVRLCETHLNCALLLNPTKVIIRAQLTYPRSARPFPNGDQTVANEATTRLDRLLVALIQENMIAKERSFIAILRQHGSNLPIWVASHSAPHKRFIDTQRRFPALF